ncbi:hypothetical protein DSO57_1022513 [Entomophthora muscae]|uniref:Uncharacterized protein n=1 Tax=Entomophthora muscae TaxID=34485 RepID=A0ACC2S4Y8_9FUNG|nr:hypothetical protein DSO57_1022513 [Entomophthora muscae]
MVSSKSTYPFKSGWEKKARVLKLVLLAQFIGLGLGAIRLLEDALHALAITKPTLHVVFTSFSLAVIFFPFLLYHHGSQNVLYMAKTRSWIFLVYVAFDILAYQSFAFARGTGSFLVFSTTQSLLGLLVAITSYFIFKSRYEYAHFIGAALSLIGVVLILNGNQLTKRNYTTGSPFSGFSYSLLGTVLLSLCYLVLEAGLHQFLLIEFLAFSGLFGFLSDLLQMGFINPWEYAEVNWQPQAIKFFALAVLLRVIVTVGTFYLVKLSTATFAAHSTLSTEFFYILVRSFRVTQAMFPYSILVQHLLGYSVLVVGQIFMAARVISQEEDMTCMVNFYRRPDLDEIVNHLPPRYDKPFNQNPFHEETFAEGEYY